MNEDTQNTEEQKPVDESSDAAATDTSNEGSENTDKGSEEETA